MNIISSGHLATFSGEHYLLELRGSYASYEFEIDHSDGTYGMHREYLWEGQGKIQAIQGDDPINFIFRTPAPDPSYGWNRDIFYPELETTAIKFSTKGQTRWYSRGTGLYFTEHTVKDITKLTVFIDVYCDLVSQRLSECKEEMLEKIQLGQIVPVENQYIRLPIISAGDCIEQGLLAEASGQVRLNLVGG